MIDLTQHVEAPAPDLDAQWQGVLVRMDRRVRRRRTQAGMAVALVAGLGLLSALRLVDRPPQREQVAGPDVPESSYPELPPPVSGTVLELGDGSTVRTAANTRIDLCEAGPADACIDVKSGAAEFLVEPRTEGRFIVRAGRVEVRVVGTKFAVARHRIGARDRVSVAVDSGRVEVVAGPDQQRLELRAGEQWMLESGVDEAGPAPAPDEANTADPPRGDPGPRPSAEAADRLWQRARDARRDRDSQAAARAYTDFLARHPNDRRVAIAALDLARLQMDVLHQPVAAIGPLETALAKRGSTHEDALARLARAYDATGDLGACQRRQREYMETYPEGVHAAAVRRLCAQAR